VERIQNKKQITKTNMQSLKQLIAQHGGTIEINWSDQTNSGTVTWSKSMPISKLEYAKLQELIDPRDIPVPNQVLVFSEATEVEI
jgi:hypothetical protein